MKTRRAIYQEQLAERNRDIRQRVYYLTSRIGGPTPTHRVKRAATKDAIETVASEQGLSSEAIRQIIAGHDRGTA